MHKTASQSLVIQTSDPFISHEIAFQGLWQQAEQKLTDGQDLSSVDADAKPLTQLQPLSQLADSEQFNNYSLQQQFDFMLQAINYACASYAGDAPDIRHSAPSENLEQAEQSICLQNLIHQIDTKLSIQLDTILHHPQWQQMESAWRSLSYLLPPQNNQQIIVEMLDATQDEWQQHFEDNPKQNNRLQQIIYQNAYDLPGAFPYSSMISGYSFNTQPPQLKLLEKVAEIAMHSHCPFIANVDHQFFEKSDINQLTNIHDINAYFSQPQYIHWQAFRKKDCARYVGLALPKFLLRYPYGEQAPTGSLNYHEKIDPNLPEQHLWAPASFALGYNIIRSYAQHGWPVHIRGPQSGGKIQGLPLIQYGCHELQIPTQLLIPEAREVALAEAGLIPLSYYAGTEFACFFSANSAQKAEVYTTDEATSNSRINARLPYVYLSSRIAHYIKVLQREVIGMQCAAQQLQDDLNIWLQSLVTKMSQPDRQLTARYPLREAQVLVKESSDNPGFFKIELSLVPHFQVEGMDVHLFLVSRLPSNKNKN